MALAELIASVTHWISSFLWVCSQPLYWMHCIYETNYDAVSALFSTVYHCLFYTAKAAQLLVVGFISTVQMIIEALVNVKYVVRSIASALFALVRFGIWISQMSVDVLQMVLEYGPWVVEKAWRGAVWCYSAIAYGVNWVLVSVGGPPTLAMLLERLQGVVLFMLDAVVSFGRLLSASLNTVSDMLTEVGALALGLVTGALTATLEAFLRCVDALWQMKTTLEDPVMMARAYSSRKAAELYAEMLEASGNALGSMADLLAAFFSNISYVGLFAILCLLLILVPVKLYGLFVKAVSLANTMVGLFQRSLSRDERNTRRGWRPRYGHVIEQRLPREEDADDASLLQPRRRAPGVPQLRPRDAPQPRHQPPDAPPAADRPGPSGQQRCNPTRPSPSPSASSPPAPRSAPSAAANDLARQLEEERDRQLCVVCQDNDKNILIIPCKHLCVCLECVEEITGQPRRDARKCPLCRQAITFYLEVYA